MSKIFSSCIVLKSEDIHYLHIPYYLLKIKKSSAYDINITNRKMY